LSVLEEDAKGLYYRKISREKDIPELLTTSYLLKDFNPKLQTLLNNPDFPIKNSDFGNLDFVPQEIKVAYAKSKQKTENAESQEKKPRSYFTPMLNGKQYYLGLKPFTITKTERKLEIYPEKDQVLKLSDNYALLINHRGSVKDGYLINLENTSGKRSMNAKQTAQRIEPWNPGKFLQRFPKETDEDFTRRVMECGNIEKFLHIYRELIDGADFNLQNFDLKKQLAFATYYSGLNA